MSVLVSLSEDVFCNKRSAKNIEIQEAFQQAELRRRYISGDDKAIESNREAQQHKNSIRL